MELEAGLPPPQIRLNTSLRQYTFRAQKLPLQHPINEATSQPHLFPPSSDPPSDISQLRDPNSRTLLQPLRQLDRIAQSIQTALSSNQEQILHHTFRPWQKELPYKVIVSQQSKEEEAKAHTAFIASRSRDNLLTIYSDASSVPKGTGIGVEVIAFNMSSYNSTTSTTTLGRICRTTNLGPNQLVYNGELEGIAIGLELATTLATPGQEVRAFADNQAALYRLATPSDRPGQAWQLRCIKAANILTNMGCTVSLSWVPGHQDILGNEIADQLAKMAAKATPSTSTQSLAMTGMKIKEIEIQEWKVVLAKHKARAI